MNKKILKSLSFLTAFLMLLCTLPFHLFAENTGKIVSSPVSINDNVGVWDGSIAESFAGGTGTEADPYLISNGAELAYLAKQVNLGAANGGSDYAGDYFSLTADIYLNDTTGWKNWKTNPPANEWQAIGWIDIPLKSNISGAYRGPKPTFYPFCGNFEGNGFAVFGLYINKPDINPGNGQHGLFGVNEGSIANLGVEASYICSGGPNSASVTAYNNGGSITNCYNTGTVYGYSQVGGVVGRSDAAIVVNCYNTGSVGGSNIIGGVVGTIINGGTITDCYNTVAVTANSNVGGVLGTVDGIVTNCYNSGNISGDNHIGGISGLNNSNKGHITACYNTGDVSGREYISGIAGFNSEFIAECYNSGAISGNRYVSGIAGGNGIYGNISECYNNGNISVVDYTYEYLEGFGGIAGHNHGNLTTSYNSGNVSGGRIVGGIVGLNNSALNNVYNTGSVIGESNVGGIAGTNHCTSVCVINCCYNIGDVTGTDNTGAVVGFNKICGTGDNTMVGSVECCYYFDGCCEQGDEKASPLTDEQLRVAENYAGFDFETVWTMEGSPHYPYAEFGSSNHAGQPYEYAVKFIDGVTNEEVAGSFSAWKGTVLDPSTFPAAPEHEGYKFMGWDYNGEPVTDDITVTAQYNINTYNAIFNINGEEYKVVPFEYGAKVTAPEYTVPEGHTFSGWEVPETMPAKDIILDAALKINTYNAIFNINGEEYKVVPFEYGAKVTAPEYTVPEGHTFSGWEVPETMPAKDIILDAALKINTYSVKFVDWDGTELKEETVEYGKPATAPEDPVREGYTFAGWDKVFDKITEDTTVTALYEEIIPAPTTGFVSFAGMGIGAILAGAGIVLLRKKRN